MNDIEIDPFVQCVSCLKPTSQHNLCGDCHQKLPVDKLWVVGYRTGALRTLIDLYKFERTRAASRTLAEVVHRRVPLLPEDTLVTYLPSIPQHQRLRGYDSMKLVADEFAKKRSATVISTLTRQHATVQTGSTRSDRLVQQHHSLRPIDHGKQSPILLIEDIYTTGGTLTAALSMLRSKTNQPIYVAILARQPIDDPTDL